MASTGSLVRHARPGFPLGPVAHVNDPLVVFARNMRRRRRALDLTQEEAGDRVHMNMSYWGRIERARIEPGVRTVVRIAAALETTPAELLGPLERGADGVSTPQIPRPKIVEDVPRRAKPSIVSFSISARQWLRNLKGEGPGGVC